MRASRKYKGLPESCIILCPSLILQQAEVLARQAAVRAVHEFCRGSAAAVLQAHPCLSNRLWQAQALAGRAAVGGELGKARHLPHERRHLDLRQRLPARPAGAAWCLLGSAPPASGRCSLLMCCLLLALQTVAASSAVHTAHSAAHLIAAALPGKRRIPERCSLAHWPSGLSLLLQAVRDLYEVKPGPAWPAAAERQTKLVVVGRGLDLVALQDGLDSCT